jgi:sulfur relay (sulfurtransferase) complex TusBCD TusD component (DsrE family)
MKRHILTVAGLLLVGMIVGFLGSLTPGLPGAFVQPALAQEEDASAGLLVNLTTDDTWSANMALSLATRAREEGLDPVIIFLNVRGVYLGDRERLPATEGNSDLNIHEKLQAFVDAGGQVIACPSCSREAGLTQDDYIEGVQLGEPGGILQFLSDPAIAVISY